MANAEDQSANKPVRVFISYSHKDREWVKTWLVPKLEERGIATHVDFRDFEIGLASLLNMERAVEQCAKTLLVLSPHWVKSEYTQFEGVMVQVEDPVGLKKKLIPVMLQDCELPRRLQILTYADLRREDERETQLGRIVDQTKKDFAKLEPTKIEFPPLPDDRLDITRLPRTGYELFGRQKELKALRQTWDSGTTNVVSFVAYGGTGKSTLVNKWLEKLRWDNYRGAKRVFAWSFYSQGTGQRVTSADQFISEALEWFGDPDPKQGSPWDKGQRLAGLVRQEKTLLLLDGLEPLQSAFDFDKGKISDPALSVLVTQLARQNNGLCVITTREKVAELQPFETGVMQPNLEQISKEAGRALLRVGGVQGTDEELESASESFGNHALAVSLLTTYLHGIKGHHVSHAASIPDLDIPEAKGKHPRRVIEAFHTRFGDSPQTQLLRVMGLFDRPPGLALIDAVKAPPAIAGLTDNLMQLDGGQWRDVLGNLRACKLLASESAHNPNVLDCHPLIREHYADKLTSEQPEAWQAAHRRLYQHLTQSTEHQPDTLPGLQPLYQAVAHGCLAGMHQQTCDKVYFDRILRGTGSDGFYSARKLGAFSSDLAAVACFFDRPFSALSPHLSEPDQAWLLNEAAVRLRALGRLTKALEPIRAGLDMRVKDESWEQAAISAGNLSELELTLGQTPESVADAEHKVDYADRSGDASEGMMDRTTLADALFQSGQADKATALFEEAEAIQAERQPQYPLLYSLQGFRYCDLLLAPAERAAWQAILNLTSQIQNLKSKEACHAVRQRATQTLKESEEYADTQLLDLALDHLSLGRAALYQAIPAKSEIRNPKSEIEEAVAGLRRAGQLDDLPRGLLSRALLRFVEKDAEGCKADLDEAWQVAERGSMKLFMADVHLHRARLFRDKAELAKARKLIDECGYHRRDPELQDAEQAAQNWQ